MLGILVRSASVAGLVYMLLLLFASNYPGPGAAFWAFFGAALSHLGLALCFGALAYAPADQVFSLGPSVRRAMQSIRRRAPGPRASSQPPAR